MNTFGVKVTEEDMELARDWMLSHGSATVTQGRVVGTYMLEDVAKLIAVVRETSK